MKGVEEGEFTRLNNNSNNNKIRLFTFWNQLLEN